MGEDEEEEEVEECEEEGEEDTGLKEARREALWREDVRVGGGGVYPGLRSAEEEGLRVS